ncbi:phage major capsid protein [Micromonospora taraxaci]|uniref:phage major capsid protein n=1 Tax=Micromonospora taraxaci TaxID=1316803 RepID=UPI003401093F
MTDFIAQANAILEKRKGLFIQLRSVHDDSSLSPADRNERMKRLNADIDALGVEAEGYVRQAEVDAENRELMNRAASLAAGGQHRESRGIIIPSRSEYRAALSVASPGDGGITVANRTANKYIDMLVAESQFLKYLPVANVIRWQGGDLRIPKLDSFSLPQTTAEAATIGQGDSEWSSIDFKAIKVAQIVKASSEILNDSALNLRQIISDNMRRATGLALDAKFFGTNAAATDILGIFRTGLVTKPTVLAGTAITFDDLLNAQADRVAVNSPATVIYVSQSVYKQLLTEKLASGAGGYTFAASGPVVELPPIVPVAGIPAKSALLLNTDRVWAGVRMDVEVKVSEDIYFETDQVGLRSIVRAAGVHVAEVGAGTWVTHT